MQVCGGAQLDGHVVAQEVVQEMWRRLDPAARLALALALLLARCGGQNTAEEQGGEKEIGSCRTPHRNEPLEQRYVTWVDDQARHFVSVGCLTLEADGRGDDGCAGWRVAAMTSQK